MYGAPLPGTEGEHLRPCHMALSLSVAPALLFSEDRLHQE